MISNKSKKGSSRWRHPSSCYIDREIQTHVVVDDGKIVVLGGLVEERRTDTKSQVPLLSNIPVSGNLFKGRDSNNDKTNLMIFIRPTIFRTTEEANQDSVNRYVQLRLEQLQHLKQTDTLLDTENEAMLLPILKSEHKPPTVRKRPTPTSAPKSRPSSRSRPSDDRT